MIILEHEAGKKVVSVLHNQDVLTFDSALTISKILFDLAKNYPEEIIVWVEHKFKEDLSINELNKLQPLEMVSYSFSGEYVIKPQIGLIDNSVFLKINPTVKYPTWLMHGDTGAIHGATLSAFSGTLKPLTNFDYFLTCIAKLGMPQGLLAYSAPALLRSKPEEVGEDRSNMSLTFNFVTSLYGIRKSGYFLLLLLIYTKKSYFWSFILSLKAKSLKTAKIQLPQANLGIAEGSIITFDVLIPTIGRKEFLKQVLEDLSPQAEWINKVVIVEQNPDPNSESQLTYIDDPWPFEIDHTFTHRTGACNARNVALEKVEAEWVFFADDDIRIPEDFMRNSSDFIDIKTPKAFTTSCLQQNEVEKHNRIIQWQSFGTSCSFVKAREVKKVYFDVGYEFGYGEDNDFGMQLRNRGVDILYNPFLRLLHLKAPVGGFRYKHKFPWDEEKPLPKPSPTIMLFQMKYSSTWQMLGYKARLFIKFYRKSGIKNPYIYYKEMQTRWKSSEKWSRKLMKQV